jgi:hypothetical protein
MNTRRIRIWVVSGAVIGALLAFLSIYDMRHYEGDWVFPSTFDGALILVPDFLIFLIALSGLMPKNIPQPIFYSLIVFLNACAYALLFLAIGSIIEAIFSRDTAIAGGQQ